MALQVGTIVEMTRDAPYKEYNVFKGDIGIINYVASTGKYSIHIYGKSNPHKDAWGKDRLYGKQGDCWIPFDYVKEYECKEEDRVEIISRTSEYKGFYGTVYSISDRWVYILVDNTKHQSIDCALRLAKTSVRLVIDDNIGGKNKMKLTGYNKVAVIEYCNKDYHFALYDDNISIGDSVLVSGSLENKQTLVVKDIIAPDEAKEVYNGDIAYEVKCKMDLSAYEQRLKNREEAEKLRKKMDEEIKKMDELNKYEMYADRNPALKEMLEQFKSVVV